MEPARGERDDTTATDESARTRTRAAMEPARGERDDRASAHCSPARSDSPQWSPLVVSGMTFARRNRLKDEIWPQWSPLVVSGMTRGFHPRSQVRAPAAMEPARGERDDCRASAGCWRGEMPQWSPLVVSGMTRRARAMSQQSYAAMEPARGERDDGSPNRRGKGIDAPQWSPLVVSGMTSGQPSRR